MTGSSIKTKCLFIINLITMLACLGCGVDTDTGSNMPGGNTDTEKSPVLHFTAIPDQNTTELMEKFQPLVDYLSTSLGVTVQYVPSRDYQASVEMFRNGDVLLAWFGGLTGVQARLAVPGAQAIAQGVEDPEYYSYFIAHKDTGLSEQQGFPEEIAALSFTFGSESSTSGRLMPEYFINENTGKSPIDFFQQTYGFSGSHDKTAELVESGQYQAGVLNYQVYDRRVAEGKTDPEIARIIWRTPTYADYNWTAHPQLETLYGTGFTARLTMALTSLDDPVVLDALTRKRLIPAANEEFEGIRKVAEALGMVR